MKRFISYLFTLILTVSTTHAQSVGLVLSGGGAKGIAHIGVIQALEDNDIPIDYITGTSMGAIVGGLYASGYTPEEMMQLLMSKGFADWSTGVINKNLTYYFDKSTPTPAFVTINFALNDSTKKSQDFIPSSLINPIPMNFAFMELFAPYTAQCRRDFNRLFVPFRCVASDIFNKRKLVCAIGDLGDAIRASMSFPIVFKPIYENGLPLFDGGIYDNFPVDVMRQEFAPEFIIGIDVSTASSKVNVNNLIDQVEAMVIQDHGTIIPDSLGVRMNINLSQFGLLDFNKAQTIYKIGYDHAIEMIDSIKGRIGSRISKESRAIARNSFKSKTPAVIFDEVNVTGTGDKKQNDYIERLFKFRNDTTFTIREAEISYYHAISSQKIKDLVPTAYYNDTTRFFALNLTATPKANYYVGLGGYLTSSTNSMLYLGARYSTLSLHSFDAGVKAWFGQSYYAGEVGAKISLHTRTPSYIGISGVTSKQKFYESDMLFYSDELPSFIINYDSHARIHYAMALGRKAKMEISIGYGALKDYFYQSNVLDFTSTKQDKATYRLGQVRIAIERNSLNNALYPTAGSRFAFIGSGMTGNYRFTPAPQTDIVISNEKKHLTWAQAELIMDNYIPMGSKFVLGTKINAILSSKQLVENYTANIVQAPTFCPTPSTQNYFNPAFRSNSYLAGGIVPLFKISDKLQFRTEFYAFAPLRKITENADFKAEYGKWLSTLNYMGEASIVYNLPFASFSIYGNYLSYPSRNWNFGVNFGLLFTAPKFLR